MKHITLIAAMLLLTAGAWAQDSKGIYKKYSDNDQVSAVYISPAMFKLMGRVPNMEVGDGSMNLGSIIKSLNSMYILDCDDKEVCQNIKSDVKRFIEKSKLELLMEIKESGESVHIYASGNDKVVSQFIMTASEDDEFTLICLDGTINRSDLEKLIEKATQEME